MIRPPILPSCLDFLFPPMRPGITSLLSVLMSSSCPPSLTMPSTLIVVRVSRSHNKCTPCHLTSSLLPCLLAFKNRRSSKMILRIIAPLVASVGAAATLKQDLCVSPMAPSFSMACCRSYISFIHSYQFTIFMSQLHHFLLCVALQPVSHASD